MASVSIAVVGSLLLDVSIRARQLVQPGGVVHGQESRADCGGRGANQACAAARLGERASLIGAVGDDILADALVSAVAREGVDTRAIVRRSGATSGCFIIVRDIAGATEIVVANGANGALSAADVERHAGIIVSAQALLVQLETSPAAVETALRIARAAGVRTILNAAPAGRSLPDLLPLCDAVTVNEQEAGALSGIPVRDTNGAARAAAAIRALGAGGVYVTLGAGGAWVDGLRWSGHLPGYAVPVVDTLGAGDTFAGALAVRLSKGADERAAAAFAAAAAALSVTRAGALPAIPSRREVEDFLAARS